VQDGTGADYPEFHATAWTYMAQLWSGNKQLHYEAWIRDRLAVIEVGLHFEADALTNARLLAAFRAHERAIRRALGAQVRIEPWDKGWFDAHLRAELPSDVAWSETRQRR
jgi:hypothetical protein